MKNYWFLFLGILFVAACSADDEVTPSDDPSGGSSAKLKFQFRFDEDQERLNNIGEPATIPSGNAAQTSDFNSMSAFFIELVPTKFTQIKEGAVVYEAKTQAAEAGGVFDEAVIFDEAIVSGEDEVFLELSIKDITPGTYEYIRASVTYQNADIKFNLKNLPAPLPPNLDDQSATLAGFIGFNTYLADFTVQERMLSINGDRQQGFWAFEPHLDEPYQSYYLLSNPEGIISGQSPAGATTVVNPLAPFGVELPFGSCIVTGELEQPLTITGEESEDILITLSFSVKKSFEWVDSNGNGEWDFDIGNNTIEPLVDMGLRGLKGKVD